MFGACKRMLPAFNYPSFLWISLLCFVNGSMWESLHMQTWRDRRSTFAGEVLHLNACTFLDYCISTCSAFRAGEEAFAGVYWCSMKWLGEDFSRTINTQQGFLPRLRGKRHFYQFIALPETLSPTWLSCNLSDAQCTVITVQFHGCFGSEVCKMSDCRWKREDYPGSAASKEAASNRINEIVCFSCFVLARRMRFLGREKPKQIPIFLYSGPAKTRITIFYRVTHACENNRPQFTTKVPESSSENAPRSMIFRVTRAPLEILW